MIPASPAFPACPLPRWRNEAFLLLFGLWQFFAMTGYAHREIVPGPALGGDQVSYLFSVYEAAALGLDQGWLAGLRRLIDGAPAAGVGLQVIAYPLQLWLGIGRDHALLPNLAAFAFLPLLAVLALGRRDLPFGAVLALAGFWLAIRSMYGVLGGPLDFRLDFFGLALFAVIWALAWRSAAFTRPRVCLLLALAAALLVVTRLIMFVHLAATGALLLLAFLLLPGLRRRLTPPGAAWGPLAGMLATGAMTALAAAPLLVLLWPRIWDYYFVGHVFGAEKDVRAAMAGFHSQLETLGFYPYEFWYTQLGTAAAGILKKLLTLGAAALVADRLWRPLSRRLGLAVPLAALHPGPLALLSAPPVLWALMLVLASIAGPYVTLNLDLQKSWVVGNVFIVPAAALVVLSVLAVDAAARRRLPPRAALLVPTVLGLLAALWPGVSYQRQILSQPSEITARGADFAERDRILAAISAVASAEKPKEPFLFVDHIGELDGLQMELSHLERYGRPLGLRRMLAQIFEVEPATLWKTLPDADFLILRAQPVPTAGNFPFDLQMARLNAELRAFCDGHCRKLGEFHCFNMPLAVYARGK